MPTTIPPSHLTPGPDRQGSRLTVTDRQELAGLAERLFVPNARDHYLSVVRAFIGGEASLRPVERDQVFRIVHQHRGRLAK